MMKKPKLQIKPSPWSQLSHDLVGEITNMFGYCDLVRFRAVCINWWHAVDGYLNNIVSLPWIVDIKTSLEDIECHLYEPSPSVLTKPTLVYKIKWHQFDIFPYYSHYDKHTTNTIHKNGWIFSSIEIPDYYFTSFLLFSPLKNKQIILPKLVYSHWQDKFIMKTFSTKPDSPDCVFLVLYRDICQTRINIRIFRHGDKEWKSQEFGDECFDYQSANIVWDVYIDGIFYFLFGTKQLASYNIALGEWKVETEFVDYGFPENMLINKVFVLNGELMLLVLSNFGDSGYIRTYDRSNKAWVPFRSLGNQSIFVSYNSVFVRTIEKEGKFNYGLLPNKIYLGTTTSEQIVVYSLESGKLAKFAKDSEITLWAKANGLARDWFEPPDDLLTVVGLSHIGLVGTRVHTYKCEGTPHPTS